MKNFFHIASWEFITRFKSRSFLVTTFVMPVLFSLLITLPVFLISYEPGVSVKLIGVIDFESMNISEKLQIHFNQNYRLENGSPEYIVRQISVNNAPSYKLALGELNEVMFRKDSITRAYNNIKDLRARYYRNTKLQNKQYLLQKSYEEMIAIREMKDLVEIEYENYRVRIDSVFNIEARQAADSLLIQGIMDAYLVVPEFVDAEGIIEYHTLNPGNLLESERMKNIINTVIIKSRLSDANIKANQVNEWLKEIRVKKYQPRVKGSKEWDFYIEFYGSVFGVFLLFMAIFTSGGFLFSSVLQEKSNRVIEILLSYASSKQIMAGKIFGLGFLGLIQVLIWLGIAAIFVFFNLFQAGTIAYLNWENAFFFLHYFSLGYLLYASIFVAIGAIFSTEQEAQQVNLILRTIAILPVLLVFFFLQEPDSELITYLSYVPLLTPYFMIMKISQLAAPLTTEIYITSGILVVSIIGMVFVAAKIFRMGIMMYGKKLTFHEIINLLRSS